MSFVEQPADGTGGNPGDGAGDADTPQSLFDRPLSWHDRRSLQPIDQLSRELDDVCTTAVDSLEIAAILEAAGTTDSVSREVYNCKNVFDLAEQLYRRTPTVPVEPESVIDADRPGSLRDLSHGVVFALNGIFFSVVLQISSSRRSIAALVAALIISWSYGQASSLLWYRVDGRNVELAGKTLLRRTLMLAMAVGLVAGYVLDRNELPPVVTLLAVGQVIFVIAAAVLLLYRKEVQFLLSLVPATVISACYGLGWPTALSTDAVLYAVVGTIAAVVLQGAWIVRPQGGVKQRMDLQMIDLKGAVQMSIYGVMGALLLSYNAVTSLVGANHDTTGFDMSVLPLVLTIGVAEWQLRSYRQLTKNVMSGTHDLAHFGSVTWRFLLRCFARYWSVLIATSVVFWVAVWTRQPDVPVESTLLSISYAVLGGAFFLNLLLISCSRIDIALRSFLGAGMVYVLVVAVPIDNPTYRAWLYLCLCVGLLVFLLIAARNVVRQALMHL